MKAAAFTEDLISVRQLVKTQGVLFTKDICYLRGPTTAPLNATILGARDEDNFCCTTTTATNDKEWTPVKNKMKNKCPAAPSYAPVVEHLTLHKTMNHRSAETLQQFAKEYPEAIQSLKSKHFSS